MQKTSIMRSKGSLLVLDINGSKLLSSKVQCLLVVHKCSEIMEAKPIEINPISKFFLFMSALFNKGVFVYRYPFQGPQGYPMKGILPGLIIFKPIKESYIAMDTWPEEEYGSMIIYGCKQFDAVKIRNTVKSILRGEVTIRHYEEN